MSQSRCIRTSLQAVLPSTSLCYQTSSMDWAGCIIPRGCCSRCDSIPSPLPSPAGNPAQQASTHQSKQVKSLYTASSLPMQVLDLIPANANDSMVDCTIAGAGNNWGLCASMMMMLQDDTKTSFVKSTFLPVVRPMQMRPQPPSGL